MKTKFRIFCLSGGLTLLTTLPVYSQEPQSSGKPTITSEQSAYVENYIDAVNSNNKTALTRQTHPKYLACITPDNHDYYDDLYQNALKRTIPANAKVSFEALTIDAVTKETNGAAKIGLPYPVHPSHQMQIDYSRSEYDFVSIIRKLVLEDGKYFEVSGCPSPQILERYRQLKIKKEKDRIEAAALFKKLRGPLLLELTELLQQGQKIAAWKRYSQETGTSIATAKAVLEHIQLEK